jgi:hypothetical protein
MKNEKIFKYLFNQIKKSMTFYWVNGNETKREMRIAEYCSNKINNLTEREYLEIKKKADEDSPNS